MGVGVSVGVGVGTGVGVGAGGTTTGEEATGGTEGRVGTTVRAGGCGTRDTVGTLEDKGCGTGSADGLTVGVGAGVGVGDGFTGDAGGLGTAGPSAFGIVSGVCIRSVITVPKITAPVTITPDNPSVIGRLWAPRALCRVPCNAPGPCPDNLPNTLFTGPC